MMIVKSTLTKRMMLALTKATHKPFGVKQSVAIKCREKWKNSIYLKPELLNGFAASLYRLRPITLHIRFYVHIDWIFFLFRFAIRACCILNLRAMGN